MPSDRLGSHALYERALAIVDRQLFCVNKFYEATLSMRLGQFVVHTPEPFKLAGTVSDASNQPRNVPRIFFRGSPDPPVLSDVGTRTFDPPLVEAGLLAIDARHDNCVVPGAQAKNANRGGQEKPFLR